MLLRRGPRLNAWLTALLSPLTGRLYPDFLALVVQSGCELAYNGQTIILEKALNDYFDPDARRIVVRNDDTEVLPQYLFFECEGQALPTLFFRDKLPHTTSLTLSFNAEQHRAGFTVYAPTLQRHDKNMKLLINRLKIALTQYQVLYVEAPK